jgi:signal transduction histidine kinase
MFSEGFHNPLRLRLAFVGVMLVLSGVLSWLGWRLLRQDEQLLAQRLAERRETAADLVVAGIERRLTAIDADLVRAVPGGVLPQTENAVQLEFREDSLRVWPEGRLPYYPAVPNVAEAPQGLFTSADDLEFKKHDYAGAIGVLQKQAAAANASVRAAALVRIARNYLKSGQPQDALRLYSQLESLKATAVGGMPAALAARLGALSVFDQQNREPERASTARALYVALASGRWPISTATYDYLAEEARRRLGGAVPPVSAHTALADGVAWLWEKWRHRAQMAQADAGRAGIQATSGPVAVLWRKTGSLMVGFVCGMDVLIGWRFADTRVVRVALLAPDGKYVLGSAPEHAGRPAIRLASSTQLPWTVQVFNADGDGELRAVRSRREWLAAGIGVLLTIVLAGGWFVGHALERELAVARLKSDFVAAVSHEFRTPLTTLCQLSELLMRDRVASQEDRQQYYILLHDESHRLRRLVERVLNFGRLEAGKMPFRFETLDITSLLRQSVTEFAAGRQASGHRFEVATGPDNRMIRADSEALRTVLWNLFENAVKYSPESDVVWVDLSAGREHVEIAVRDTGVGIPGSEQRRIFEKFERGAAARASNIRGTGVGLAMARQIVRGHGGEITVSSEPGRGSTFRVILPVANE